MRDDRHAVARERAQRDQQPDRDRGRRMRPRGERGQRRERQHAAREHDALAHVEARVEARVERADRQHADHLRDRHRLAHEAALSAVEAVHVVQAGARPQPEHRRDHRVGDGLDRDHRGEAGRAQDLADAAQHCAQRLGCEGRGVGRVRPLVADREPERGAGRGGRERRGHERGPPSGETGERRQRPAREQVAELAEREHPRHRGAEPRAREPARAHQHGRHEVRGAAEPHDRARDDQRGVVGRRRGQRRVRDRDAGQPGDQPSRADPVEHHGRRQLHHDQHDEEHAAGEAQAPEATVRGRR